MTAPEAEREAALELDCLRCKKPSRYDARLGCFIHDEQPADHPAHPSDRDIIAAARAAGRGEVEERIEALEGALRAWVELDERWNDTDWDNQQEYDAEYRRIFVEACALLSEPELPEVTS